VPASYGGGEPHIHIRVIAQSHEQLLSRYVPAGGARRGSIRLVVIPEDLWTTARLLVPEVERSP
jgi:hypothetical protein